MAEPEVEQHVDYRFSSPSTTSDVVLVVEDGKLHVSKSVLALASPVFERMFYGDFKEKDSSEVPLPGKKYEDMLKFLLCIYPATFVSVDHGNVEAVMMLADEYQVQLLLDKCIAFLTSLYNDQCYYTTTTFNPHAAAEVIHFLHISESNDNLKKVYDYYLDVIARRCRFKQNVICEEFHQLSLETRYKVVLKRLQFYDNSNDTNKRF